MLYNPQYIIKPMLNSLFSTGLILQPHKCFPSPSVLFATRVPLSIYNLLLINRSSVSGKTAVSGLL